MKNFENVNLVKQKMKTTRRITGIISIIIFPIVCLAPFKEFGQSEIYRNISDLIIYVNTTLYFFSSWMDDKLKNVY